MSLQYLHMYFPCKYNSESLKLAKTQGLVIFISNIFSTYFVHFYLVFTKTVNSNFRAFWWVPVTWNILGYSLFFDRSQDGVSFRDIFRQKIWGINEAVVQTNTKKATKFGLSVFTGS